jgi:hypothetical protein
MNNDRLDVQQLAFNRAMRSITCLPFKRLFYEKVDQVSMNAEELCSKQDWDLYVFVPFGKERAEEHFNWMIRLGILRREVDGQGLTSRIRLTPLGRKVVSRIHGEVERAGIPERIAENLRRHQWIG